MGRKLDSALPGNDGQVKGKNVRKKASRRADTVVGFRDCSGAAGKFDYTT
jgi:hypothetical protein